VAPSYADIFYNNCFKNGILPVILEEYEIEDLFIEVEKIPGFQLDVDLVSQTITTDSAREYNFELDEFRKDCLINGLDEIGLTLQHADLIKKYEKHRENRHPWVFGAIK
jgi:3-isopropylmalate/(R)-2-methylmalate dehydratase small subunit